MGEALRGSGRRGRERARAVGQLLVALLGATAPAWAQEGPLRLSEGRFTVVADQNDAQLARSLLEYALQTDTFPGLPRPRARVTIAIAADGRQFRQLIGPTVPEWGSAVAFPYANRIVMQGRRAGSRAGDPIEVLRHELAHLALHETLGDLAPRWFDEGYASFAAREWSREDALRANLALVIRGTPTLDELERWFNGGASRAEAAYALSYRAVAELAELDQRRGLSVLFREWVRTRKLDTAIRNAYGLTLAAFEARWRARTRRRYGGLAALTDITLAALLVIVTVLPLYVARRRRDRRRMAALVAADEAADRAARESALVAFLRPDTGNGGLAATGNEPEPEPGDTR
jgi:peptidase MA superfamily protein